MDIVSNLPFTLYFNTDLTPRFSLNERDIYSDDFPYVELTENNPLSVFFDSSDSNARLYFDALDVLSNETIFDIDENGLRYKKPTNNTEWIINHDSNFEGLRVDAYPLLVICNNVSYFSIIYVSPKQLDLNEWHMMRDDLENEMKGMAQDVLRRNMGFHSFLSPDLTQETLYKYYVIRKYSKTLISSVMAISDAPKYQIITKYECREEAKVTKIDDYTVRKLLNNSGKDSAYYVPVKQTTYDVQENRLLKNIIHTYDYDLTRFISLLQETLQLSEADFYNKNIKITRISKNELNSMLKDALRLRQITNIIKSKNWYKTIGSLTNGFVPHSLILDSRYSALYKMYQELRHLNFEVVLDSHYFYCWKKSSTLYEMWCYIKICRVFTTQFTLLNELWSQNESNDFMFPFLYGNTKMIFTDNILKYVVTYNQTLPTNAQNTDLDEHPCYTVGIHRKPDITIDVYSVEEDWFIGSIILECKYRKLSSFWLNKAVSSRSQIQSYYTDIRSPHQLGKVGAIFDSHPVKKIIVLTPDFQGDNVEAPGINTTIKTLRPSNDDSMIENIIDSIFDGVENMLGAYEAAKKLNI